MILRQGLSAPAFQGVGPHACRSAVSDRPQSPTVQQVVQDHGTLDVRVSQEERETRFYKSMMFGGLGSLGGSAVGALIGSRCGSALAGVCAGSLAGYIAGCSYGYWSEPTR